MHTKSAGFTLLELLSALVIVGILSAISLPVYRDQIDKANNNKSIGDIYAIQTCLERFYTVNFNYPNSLDQVATCLPNNGLDPWGNAYQYLNIVNGGPGIKGKVRKDKKTNPINTNYDLFSLGKNKVTKIQLTNKDSLDDIVLARDGGFVGLAADF